jgi:hypothetical protein
MEIVVASRTRIPAPAARARQAATPPPHHRGPGLPADAGRKRRKLNIATIDALQAAFDRGGKKAIDKVMRMQPALFLKMLVLLVPREMEVTHSNAVKSMTDQQIEDAILAIEAMLARKSAGANAKVIDYQPDATTLPAPKRRKRSKTRKADSVPNSDVATGEKTIDGSAPQGGLSG